MTENIAATTECPSQARIRIAKINEVGDRSVQQDSIGFWPETDTVCADSPMFAVVADGAGGHAGGEKASQAAIRTMEGIWNNKLKNGVTPEEAEQILHDALIEAHNAIIAEAGGNARLSGKSAIVCLYLNKGNYTVAHVGDCRAYVADGTEWNKPITRDDSLLRLMIDIGEVDPSEERNHPDQNILTQALGTDRELKPHVANGTCSPAATFLLCCDGLWNQLPEELWDMSCWDTSDAQGTLEKMGQEAIKAANGKSDNVSAIWMLPEGISLIPATREAAPAPAFAIDRAEQADEPITSLPIKQTSDCDNTTDVKRSCCCDDPISMRFLAPAVALAAVATVATACFLFLNKKEEVADHIAATEEATHKAAEEAAKAEAARKAAEEEAARKAAEEEAARKAAEEEAARIAAEEAAKAEAARKAAEEAAKAEAAHKADEEEAKAEAALKGVGEPVSSISHRHSINKFNPNSRNKQIKYGDTICLEIIMTEDGVKDVYIHDAVACPVHPEHRMVTVYVNGARRRSLSSFYYTSGYFTHKNFYYHYSIGR